MNTTEVEYICPECGADCRREDSCPHCGWKEESQIKIVSKIHKITDDERLINMVNQKIKEVEDDALIYKEQLLLGMTVTARQYGIIDTYNALKARLKELEVNDKYNSRK